MHYLAVMHLLCIINTYIDKTLSLTSKGVCVFTCAIFVRFFPGRCEEGYVDASTSASHGKTAVGEW